MKCKEMVDIADGKEVVAKNNTKMHRGKCPSCGTTVVRILGRA